MFFLLIFLFFFLPMSASWLCCKVSPRLCSCSELFPRLLRMFCPLVAPQIWSRLLHLGRGFLQQCHINILQYTEGVDALPVKCETADGCFDRNRKYQLPWNFLSRIICDNFLSTSPCKDKEINNKNPHFKRCKRWKEKLVNIHTFDSLIRPDMCSIWKQKEKQITDRTSLSFSLLKWWGTSTVVDAHVSQEEFPSISSWERFRKINSIHKNTLWDRIQYNSKIIWAFKSRWQTYCVWIWLKPVFVQRRTRKYKDLGPGSKCSKAYCNATVTCFVCKAKPSVSLPVLWKRVRWLGWGFVPAGCHTAWPGECW